MSDSVPPPATLHTPDNPSLNEVVTLVIKHRVTAGREADYESWLRRIVTIAGQQPGHLGVDVIRSKDAGLQMFTSVLRFQSTLVMQQWLDSDERRQLVAEAAPMLADGDQTQVKPHNEFWFTPPTEDRSPPPRWKQACVSYMVILPLTLLIPQVWRPVFTQVSWLSGYFISTALVTVTIVLLVVYVLMPAATRLLAPWLNASAKYSQGK
ncbi:antibiotic biosynthesis monooxygenase [Pseudomonas cannabina]|uniref:Antibiotic biosynthesis monooxygenase n=1 Tax=Pseudomonas cannabina TaxID=86840 RepID=A0A0P9LWS7_PSECA|nr:antibiotic biosynthesis monooxygenase [Pseudomonas cannabina]KAA8719205.1 antibiotic biosynthesis monooxygenase [Pseudomonas cannabina]KPW75211.1 Antibiotic biosynthesis monooxygenase [Pseudomonas cannabina]RMN32946.1 Antibiotic biosynthesis monooxygenase [Pseudomonas cannabina]SDQ99622.1 hypothetical protein SAMN05216597_1908 [Pseudomonas cannabina]